MTKTFYEWLTSEDHEDQQIKDIAEIAKNNKEKWLNVSSISSGITAIKSQEAINDSDTIIIVGKLGTAYDNYNSNIGEIKNKNDPAEVVDPRRTNWLQRQFEYIFGNPKVIFSIITCVFAIGVIYFLARNIDSTSLTNISSARGIIAVMFAGATLAAAFMIIYNALYDEKTEFKEKFDLAKQIFTAILGVFATIVGFYFGSLNQTPPENPTGGDVKIESGGPNAGSTTPSNQITPQ